MTPAARAQAAIDLLDQVVAAAERGGAAADTLIARYFKERRYAGSKDRRAVRELVYAAIRRAGERPISGRAALLGLVDDRPDLAEAFDGGPHAPAPIQPDEPRSAAGVAPQWLIERLGQTLAAEELPALLDRAPLDLRVNRLKTDRHAVREALPEAQPGTLAHDALRLPEGFPIDRSPLWQDGLVEVQDEGSQLVVEACRARSGETVVDLCAGAGGKTLALAAAMGGARDGGGRLIACDVDRRLSRLAPRAERAGADAIEMRLLDGGREEEGLLDLRGAADCVLIDAPCSGSGTWRRNPEARWRLDPMRLDRLRALQARVLALGAGLVKPGGRMVYAVCSLLAEEGPDRITAFLHENPGWQGMPDVLATGRALGPGRLLTPASDGTDGFFIASLRRA